MRRSLTTLTTTAALLPVLLVAGCGSDSTSTADADRTASGSPTGASADRGVVIDVNVKGDKVTPNSERVTAKVGQPVTLHVTADRAGELHVHSTPEHELEYHAGKTTLKVTIDKPGIVDIEDHIADVVVVQLEVS